MGARIPQSRGQRWLLQRITQGKPQRHDRVSVYRRIFLFFAKDDEAETTLIKADMVRMDADYNIALVKIEGVISDPAHDAEQRLHSAPHVSTSVSHQADFNQTTPLLTKIIQLIAVDTIQR